MGNNQDIPKLEKRAKLNDLTLEQLNVAKNNWNKDYSEFATLQNFAEIGTITTFEERDKILRWTLKNHWILNIDAKEPNIFSFEPYVELPFFVQDRREKAVSITNYLNDVLPLIEIGSSVVALNWKAKKIHFSTLALVGIEGIKFDSMLSNVFTVRKRRITKKIRMSCCGQYECSWIWGSVRGRVSACVGNFEKPFECNGSTDAWMILGKPLSELRPYPPMEHHGCCKSIWIYAFTTPFASVQISPSAFAGLDPDAITISINGLGSKIYGKEILRHCLKNKKSIKK